MSPTFSEKLKKETWKKIRDTAGYLLTYYFTIFPFENGHVFLFLRDIDTLHRKKEKKGKRPILRERVKESIFLSMCVWSLLWKVCFIRRQLFLPVFPFSSVCCFHCGWNTGYYCLPLNHDGTLSYHYYIVFYFHYTKCTLKTTTGSYKWSNCNISTLSYRPILLKQYSLLCNNNNNICVVFSSS